MKKQSIAILVASLAAVAGCQSSGGSAKAEKPAKQPQVSGQQSGTVAAQPAPSSGSTPMIAQPDSPASSSSSSSIGSGDASGANAGTASTSGSGAIPGDHASGAPYTSDEAPPKSATSDTGSSGSSTSSTTPAADEKASDQRGSVLTNDGPVQPKGSQSGAQPSMNDAASSEAVDSLHIDHPDNVIARPPLGDQATLGTSESDRMLVQRIRQAVVDDETISNSGRSVQIQSQDGQIVLKGEVDSERERQRIGDTAFRESGGKMVINQLDVVNKQK